NEEGGREQLLKLAKELGIERKVCILEPTDDASPAAVIARYDILCMPSRHEGFGRSALEAMIAGRPVLIAEEAGVSPFIQAAESGVLVRPDAASIVDGLRKLLAVRSEWKSMGLRGRNLALEALNWKHIGRNALHAYQQYFPTFNL